MQIRARPWDINSHWSHWYTLIFRGSVQICARQWLVSSPADKTSFCGFDHWTARNFTEPRGLFNKQLQQDLVYNNINNFVQQQFRGGTNNRSNECEIRTHPHGRDCFYCWFFIVGIVENIPLERSLCCCERRGPRWASWANGVLCKSCWIYVVIVVTISRF